MQGLRCTVRLRCVSTCATSLALVAIVGAAALAAEPDEPANEAQASAQIAQTSEKKKRSPAKDPPGMKRLVPDADLWIDPKNKRVVVDGTVVLREGFLEMFACPTGTKEHESIVAVDAKAYAVHAGLLAAGAKTGAPATFQPEYKPATGSQIDIDIVWRDVEGNDRRAKAQDWVRDIDSGEALKYPWVFAGSGFWTDEASGIKYYMAEQGDFICVSNFPSAMLDLPVPSSQDNQNLAYEAFTERIPPLGTRVRLVLTPKQDEK